MLFAKLGNIALVSQTASQTTTMLIASEILRRQQQTPRMIATGIRNTQPKTIAIEQMQRQPNKPITHNYSLFVCLDLIVANAWQTLIAVSNGKLFNSSLMLALPLA